MINYLGHFKETTKFEVFLRGANKIKQQKSGTKNMNLYHITNEIYSILFRKIPALIVFY